MPVSVPYKFFYQCNLCHLFWCHLQFGVQLAWNDQCSPRSRGDPDLYKLHVPVDKLLFGKKSNGSPASQRKGRGKSRKKKHQQHWLLTLLLHGIGIHEAELTAIPESQKVC
jgi:hypothetical protein